MNIRRLLPLLAIPVLVGTFGCGALHQATAQSPNQLAQNSSQPDQQGEGHKNHRRLDFAAAAQKLGVSEAQLKDALGIPANLQPGQRPPRPDFAAAATKLGVTQQQLMDALGVHPHSHQDGKQPNASPTSGQ